MMSFAVFLLLLVIGSDVVMSAGSAICAGMLCSNGQCVSRSAFCNGNCDCGDCSDEKVQTCPMYDGPDRGSDGSGLGSGAIIGIVVAAICFLLLLIGILIVFLICRIRRQAIKNRQNRRLQLDHLTPGCALPVDIPIEALAREPPPQYTPRADQGQSEEEQFNISVLPPPYYAPGAPVLTELSCSYEAPPKYQSQNDLTKAIQHPKMREVMVVVEEPLPVDRRRTSVDSFDGEPSMVNILLTSSRSSDLGFTSNDLSSSSISFDASGQPRGSRGLSHQNIVRGDSTDSGWHGSSTSKHFSSLATGIRSQSLSNVRCGSSLEVPQMGIQKKIDDPQNGLARNPLIPCRSVPSLYLSEELHPPGNISKVKGVHKEASSAADLNKRQQRYRKKPRNDKVEGHCDGTDGDGRSTAMSPPRSSGDALNARRGISRSLPQLAILTEESNMLTESCEV